MGKKGKALKIKQYKVPAEKFLVVIKPWGVYGNFDDADFNHIGAWFEIMLRDEYPKTRVKAIYYQRTHRNIIVELPKEVEDIEQFLGAHFYSKFFLDAAESDEAAYIYEYKYAKYGDPAKTFGVGNAMYDKIPDDLPIKYPYPLPSPAPPPPMDVLYAQAIPPEVYERRADLLPDRTRVRPPEPGPSMVRTISRSPSFDRSRQVGSGKEALAGSPDNAKGNSREIVSPSAENNFIPYVRPGYLNSTLTERLKWVDSSKHCSKIDPYEQEERAKSLLNSSDKGDDAQAFLVSVLDGVKMEETLAGTTYKPSAELLDAFNSLPVDLLEPNVGVKAQESPLNIKFEPTEVTLSCNSDYRPSDDLLAALATLPDNMTASGETECPIKSEPSEDFGIRIKEEQRDAMGFMYTPKNISSSQFPRSWNRVGVPQKRQSQNKRPIQDVPRETQPESPKRIKREE